MKTQVKLFVLVFVALAASAQAQQTFYANDFTSLRNAINSVNAGSGRDTIEITGDISSGSPPTIEKNVTITAATNPDGTPKYTLDRCGFTFSLITSFVIENLKITNSGLNIFLRNAGVAKIDNCVIDSAYYYGISVNSNGKIEQVTISNSVITNSGDNGIFVYSSADGLAIKNCMINNNRGSGMATTTDNQNDVSAVNISNCTINNNERHGISIYRDNITIDSCTVYNNKQSGINSTAAIQFTISNSTINDNGAGNYQPFGTSISGHVIYMYNCTAAENDILLSGHYGIVNRCIVKNGRFISEFYGGIISNSTVINNGFYLYTYTNNTGDDITHVINCTAYGCGSQNSGFCSGSSQANVRIYNSIAYHYDTSSTNASIKWTPSLGGNMYVYNTVYESEMSHLYTYIIKDNCITDDPKIQGKTAAGTNTNNPNEMQYYALGDSSSALWLADANLINVDYLTQFGGLSADAIAFAGNMITEGFVYDILMRDQRGNVRLIDNDGKYDAGSIAFNIAEDPQYYFTYSPKKAGNYGNATVIFCGYGLDSNATISLKKQGENDIVPDTIRYVYSSASDIYKCYVVFDFDNKALGLWDVVVDFGDTVKIVQNGFELEAYIEPAVYMELLGPSFIMAAFNGYYTYVIKYTNTGNVNAYGQPLIVEIVAPKHINISIREDWEYIFSDGDEPADFADVYDEARNLEDIFEENETTHSIFTAPMLPVIQPYEVGYLAFGMRARNNHSGDQFEMIGNVPPKIRQITGECVQKTLETTAKLGWDVAKSTLGMIPGVGCGMQIAEGIVSTGLDIANENLGTGRKVLNAVWELGKIIAECATDVIPVGYAAKTAIKMFKVVATVNDVTEHATNLVETHNVCKEPPGGNPGGGNFGGGNHGGGNYRNSVKSVGSWDPNDKYGPTSASGSKAFSDLTEFSYMIEFENVDTATAPAKEVWIIDTLDLNVFDINTFEAGLIKVGNKIIDDIPFETKNHTWYLDMEPEIANTTVKITLELNKLKGIATWYFQSLYTDTKEPATDALEGFLPPNDSTGCGQGMVLFTIKLKDGLLNNVVVANKASIIFDNNEAILTPEWVNKKDVVPPSSAMQKPVHVNDTLVTLRWQGTDNAGGSGVYFYDIYLKQGNSEYEMIYGNTTATSTPFAIEENVKYSFYTIATDSAGNTETKTRIPDITIPEEVNIKELGKQEQTISLIPNPANTECTITFEVEKAGNISVSLSNMLGANLLNIYDGYAGSGVFKQRFDIRSLPAGVYTVTINTGGKIVTKKLMIL